MWTVEANGIKREYRTEMKALAVAQELAKFSYDAIKVLPVAITDGETYGYLVDDDGPHAYPVRSSSMSVNGKIVRWNTIIC